jgi:hypothetical protein
MQQQRQALTRVYSTTAEQLEATFALMKAQGAGTSTDADQVRAELARLTLESATQTQSLDDAIASLSTQETDIINSLSTRPVNSAAD